MKRFRGFGRILPLALTALLLLTGFKGCATIPTHSLVTKPPEVRCEERSPAEDAAALPSGSEDFRLWRKAALAWVGIATAEVTKRGTTADCLDKLRSDGVIR